MSAHCQVTGRKRGFGNAVSHSHRRTRRRRSPNIQVKTYYLPSEDRRVTLRVSAKGIKVIDRRRYRGRRRAAAPTKRQDLMGRNEVPPIVKLRSAPAGGRCLQAGTGYPYVTRKNRRNDPDRLVLRKYDPIIRRHVDFREER